LVWKEASLNEKEDATKVEKEEGDRLAASG